MKKYNPDTRKYEETTQGSLKKPKACKGGKPHDFEVVLPEYIKTLETPTPEMVRAYYASEKRQQDFLKGESELLARIGINRMFGFSREVHVSIKCTRCGKKDYTIMK